MKAIYINAPGEIEIREVSITYPADDVANAFREFSANRAQMLKVLLDFTQFSR